MNPIKRHIIEWIVQFLPPCDVITHRLSEARDRKLPLRSRIKVRLHLWLCVWCTRYAKQIGAIDTAVKNRAHQVLTEESPRHRLSDDARRRIKEALRVDTDRR